MELLLKMTYIAHLFCRRYIFPGTSDNCKQLVLVVVEPVYNAGNRAYGGVKRCVRTVKIDVKFFAVSADNSGNVSVIYWIDYFGVLWVACAYRSVHGYVYGLSEPCQTFAEPFFTFDVCAELLSVKSFAHKRVFGKFLRICFKQTHELFQRRCLPTWF